MWTSVSPCAEASGNKKYAGAAVVGTKVGRCGLNR
jgi:hypothetical protein